MEAATEAAAMVTFFFTQNPQLWQASVLAVCTTCSFTTARLLSRKQKRNIIYVILPVTVFLILSVVHAASFVSASFFNFAVMGTVTGIIMSITPAVFQPKKLLVTVKRDEFRHEVLFDDSTEVTTRSLHTLIAESLVLAPEHLKIESGRGAFVEDLDGTAVRTVLRPLPGSAETERAICYVHVDTSEDAIHPLGNAGKKNSRTSIVSLLANKLPPKLNLRAEVRLGALVHMLGKMPNAADDASAFTVGCVQTYAAATTNYSAKYVGIKFRPWNNQGIMGGDVDDSTSIGAMSSGTPEETPVRCGSTVVIECDGKFLTVVRGKWLCWNSTIPRRSGAFSVEIWEKEKQDHHRLSKLSHMLSSVKPAESPTPGTSSSTISKILPPGEILRSGDYFRLRSVKFPDMEIGVTNVRLENDFFYMGFAKVGDLGGNGWSMPLRLSVKIM